MRHPATRSARIIKGGLAYFAVVFGAGFVLGVFRVLFLVPRFGERLAELGEMPVMLVVIVASARSVTRRFAIPPVSSARIGMGTLALGLLLCAELALAVALQGRSLAEYIASRDPVAGTAYLVMLVVFAAMPALVGRSGIRGARTP
jgi:hypothetical protein